MDGRASTNGRQKSAYKIKGTTEINLSIPNLKKHWEIRGCLKIESNFYFEVAPFYFLNKKTDS